MKKPTFKIVKITLIVVAAMLAMFAFSACAGCQTHFDAAQKRGVAFMPSSAQNLDLLASGAHGISWFHNNTLNIDGAIESAAREKDIQFVPMVWDLMDDNAENNLREFAARNPQVRFVQANVPSNMTPAQFAEHENGWRRLRRVARNLNLSIISPTRGFAPANTAVAWLEEFFAHRRVNIRDIHAIAVHVTASDPSAFKLYVEQFEVFNRPLWVTEFAGVGNFPFYWQEVGMAAQARFMSQTVAFLAQNPLVEKYAWAEQPSLVSGINDNLFLLTRGDNPQKTQLGQIYTNMSIFDSTHWFCVSSRIDAAQMTRNNIYNVIGHHAQWTPSVNFAVLTDTDTSAGNLEVNYFMPGRWVEYQIEVKEAGNFSLHLRHFNTEMNRIEVSVNGALKIEPMLDGGEWRTTNLTEFVPLIQLGVGRHTIRIAAGTGNRLSSLNWLELVRA